MTKADICGVLTRALYKDMSEHKVKLKWERGGAEFSYQKYPCDHTWSFDGGHTMTATAAPAYLGNPTHVDPEEAFVASLSERDDAREPKSRRDTDGTPATGKNISHLILLALPRGLEPLFSP